MSDAPRAPVLSRRRTLVGVTLTSALGGVTASGCSSPAEEGDIARDRRRMLPPPEPDVAPPGDAVDALCDVLLPSEPGVPGAREADVAAVLRLEGFVPLAVARGLLPPLPPSFLQSIATADARSGLRRALAATLDVLAGVESPQTPFRELTVEARERLVARGFDDPAHRLTFLVVRAACFTAYLGATTNDAGLRAVGFPAFEDWDDRLACSGYPRRSADGTADDHTYARDPGPTAGDDLALVLDDNGDLR